MPPKKKKTQLKPVARGFATISVPKKVTPEIAAEPEATTIQESSNAKPSSTDASQPAGGSTTGAGTSNKSTADPRGSGADVAGLQSLVDKLQEKTEKEISRILKTLEVDRRFSQTLPFFDIDPILRERILETARESSHDEEGNKLEGSEDKNLARIGVTYGVLRRMGFQEDQVIDCLNKVPSVELDDALDWLYFHHGEDTRPKGKKHHIASLPQLGPLSTNLDDGKFVKICKTTSGQTRTVSLSPPSTPRTAAEEPTAGASKRQKHAPAGKEVSDSTSTLKAQILSSMENASSEDDDESLISRFIQLKLRLDSTPRPNLNERRALQELITETTQDHLFDEKRALTVYAQERQRSELQRLSAAPLQSVSSQTSKPTAGDAAPEVGTIATSTPVRSDVFDEDDELTGGVLGLLEVATAKEVIENGVTVQLKDMAIPKNWSGQTPRVLLRDVVARADRHATVSYTLVSRHSRANRASVMVAWSAGKREEWVMDNVACRDQNSAEQYIATVSLHSLTYPLTDGFAAAAPSSTGSHTAFRLLPPVYRDFWDELEVERKARVDTVNRDAWKVLQSIVRAKMRHTLHGPEKSLKPSTDGPDGRAARTFVDNRDSGAVDMISANFCARQSGPAYQAMLAQRNELPIAHYREEIIQALETSQVLVLSGETGCGKSTQLPAFILEHHLSQGKHCRIYCTEPRRISAISLAHRVSYELCDPPNSVGTAHALVGYSIRLESNIHKNTRLAFVTNGIALRMLEGGSNQGGGVSFDEITHIIVDEVHERTIESDFLLIVLRRLIQERPQLKVVLMSATLDAEKISTYFGGCPILQVPGRTFPVEVKYLEDAIEATKWSISETSPYARRVNDKYYKGKNRVEWTEDLVPLEDDEDSDNPTRQAVDVKLERRYSPETANTLNTIDERLIPYDLVLRLLETICYEDETYYPLSAAILIFMPGLGEIRRLNDMLSEHSVFGTDAFKIFPLHSTLSNEAQSAVFDKLPPGVRKIVIATNIAETGITIPDITCVIDSGKHREMRFDEKRQISRLVETFIARSNAAQRRGRAGRVQAGLCFHLFTKLRHDTLLADSPLPEMMRLSLSDLALRIKIMKVKLGSSIEDVLCQALDPPIPVNVQRAVSMLVEVRALTASEEITSMGRLLSKLPTDVHLGKFLLIATLFRCLDPALTIAATLNSKSPFIVPLGLEHEADRAKATFRIENSDFMTIHNAYSSWRRACGNTGYARKFCKTHFLSHQNLQQIEDLRQQFLGYLIDSNFIKVDPSLIRELNRARSARGRTRFVTVPPQLDVNSTNSFIVHATLAAGLYPKILTVDPKSGALYTLSNNQPAFVHPSSVNFGRNITDFNVNYLSYFTLMHSKKLYVWEIAPVDELALLLLCGECEWKLRADTVMVDRKVKLRIPARTGVALKLLREQLAIILGQQYKGKQLAAEQKVWEELAHLALGKTKLVEPSTSSTTVV